MRLGRYIEEIARVQLDDAVLERHGRNALEDQSDVLDRASRRSDPWPYMF
jgi:hypothetical protein